MPRRLLPALIALCALLLAAAPAGAIVRLPAEMSTIPDNPADKLAELPIEDPVYDPARRCSRVRRPGVEAFTAWLAANFRGASWGAYRCERWGKGQASLHAEGRALDWHLDAAVAADKREAKRLILLLLAPDKLGQPHALARRMGVQEIIWDCGYWGSMMSDFTPYRPCLSESGRVRRRVNPTIAHRDHVHIGFTKAGAAKKTSFWAR